MSRTVGTGLVVVSLGLGALAGWTGPVLSRTVGLPPSPVSLETVARASQEGRAVLATLKTRPPGAGVPRRVDLYVALLTGWERPVFLAPDHRWAARPVAYRTGVAPGELHALEVLWPEPRLLGMAQVIVLLVREGGHPLVRSEWAFQPLLGVVTVRAGMGSLGDRSVALLGLGGLIVASLAAIAVVQLTPAPGAPKSGAVRENVEP